jgi:predicted phosphodiesterase
MIIRYMSDLHIEYDRAVNAEEFKVPFSKEDQESVLVLAGDIDYINNVKKFIKPLSSRFKNIIYVPGIREFYYSNLNREKKYLYNGLKD